MDNNYVDCSECGHPIEKHTQAGCHNGECTCREAWTVAQIRAARKLNGLPGSFKRENF